MDACFLSHDLQRQFECECSPLIGFVCAMKCLASAFSVLLQRPESTGAQKPRRSSSGFFDADCETPDSVDMPTYLLPKEALFEPASVSGARNPRKVLQSAGATMAALYPTVALMGDVGEELPALLLHRGANPNVVNVEHNLRWGFDGDHSARHLPLPPLASGPM